jgi:hypothetical protein
LPSISNRRNGHSGRVPEKSALIFAWNRCKLIRNSIWHRNIRIRAAVKAERGAAVRRIENELTEETGFQSMKR